MTRPVSLLVLASLALMILAAGCTSYDPGPGCFLRMDRTNEVTSLKNLHIDTARVTGSNDSRRVEVAIRGSQETTWEEREVQGEQRYKTERSYDSPDFRRITSRYKPFSWTVDYVEADWTFNLTKHVGFYPLTGMLEWDKVFTPSKTVGFFPASSTILEDGKQPLRAMEWGDGRIDCPLFPCTLSDEEFKAVLATAFYPLVLMGSDFSGTAFLAPVTAVMNPVIDAGAYAFDVIAMAGAVGLEAIFIGAPVAGDTVLMAGALAGDIAKGAGVLAVDSVVSGLALLGDSCLYMGDAVWPGELTTTLERTGKDLPGPWNAQTNRCAPGYTNYVADLRLDGIRATSPCDETGAIQLQLGRIDQEGLSRLVKPSVIIRDKRTGAALDEKELQIDLDDEGDGPPPEPQSSASCQAQNVQYETASRSGK